MTKRPSFLNYLLLFLVVGTLMTMFSQWIYRDAIKLINLPQWHFAAFMILRTADLLAFGLVWKWKKLGFYLYTISSILGIYLTSFIPVFSLIHIIVPLISIGLLYTAMRPVWKNFR
jgi:hypothetical protein